MSAQSEGNYAEALQNYYEAMRLDIDPYDWSYILYNIGGCNKQTIFHYQRCSTACSSGPYISY